MRIKLQNDTFQVDVTFKHFDPNYGIGLRYKTEATATISFIADGKIPPDHDKLTTIATGKARFKRNEKFTRHKGHQLAIADALNSLGWDKTQRQNFWSLYWKRKFDYQNIRKAQKIDQKRLSNRTTHTSILDSIKWKIAG